MIDENEIARLMAIAGTATDTIARAADTMAETFDGLDPVLAGVLLGNALAGAEQVDRGTFARVVGVMAIRHRRAIAAAMDGVQIPAEPPAAPLPPVLPPPRVLLWTALLGVLAGVLLAAAVLR